ncbi:MAG TPA: sirohydrochlorin chelatase [Nocardioidaceae bacterium]|nr:sirohydrochlorin chelatase [Nocardioidaceae bacterium]
MKPRLVTVAHGTRDAEGPRAIRALVRRVARRLPDVDVVESYVELTDPSFESVMASTEGPSVVVPLLLSTGYHVNHDLPESARRSAFPVVVARPLGPHPLLAAAGAMQLRAAGATAGDAVVLVAAGSKDPDATVDAMTAARLLRGHWGAPVRAAFLSGAGPGVPEVVARLRAEGARRVVASPYLLAPGHFATRTAALAAVNGVTTVAGVLGTHPLLAELVVRRYVAARLTVLGSSPRRSRVA